MTKATMFLAAGLILMTSVNAHGYVSMFTVDGKGYPGNVPGEQPSDSVIRQISTISPITGTENPNISCGQNAQTAALIADVNPGSQINFTWRNPTVVNWFHDVGPIITYMASCADTPCYRFNSSEARWFKIDQAGQKSTGGWYQKDLTTGNPYSTEIPATLATGQYLIRHEIVALHLGLSLLGAEFYVACIQVSVKGAQTGTPSPQSLVSFPGAYHDSDAGILVPDIYDPRFNYTFPGPSLVTLLAEPSPSLNSHIPSSGAPATPLNPLAPSAESPCGTPCTSIHMSRVMRNLARDSAECCNFLHNTTLTI